MVDISLCDQTECPKFDKCERNPKHYHIGMLQVYFSPEYDEDGCSYYFRKERDG